MRHFRILAALGLLGAATAANAGVSSTWTLTNDYDLRGTSQSSKDPAIQGSIDYAAESGWYVGAWGSNVNFGPGVGVGVEADLYTGFTGQSEGGLGYDVGLIHYTYPDETDFNYLEAYGSISKGWFKGKLWYSNDFGGSNTVGKTSAFYLEGNGSLPLPQNFSLAAHLGFSFGDYWDEVVGDKQIDYSLGVGYTMGNFNLGLKYVGTDGTKVHTDTFNNEGRVIFTVATTFPWSNN